MALARELCGESTLTAHDVWDVLAPFAEEGEPVWQEFVDPLLEARIYWRTPCSEGWHAIVERVVMGRGEARVTFYRDGLRLLREMRGEVAG